jgi:hypothetical protein
MNQSYFVNFISETNADEFYSITWNNKLFYVSLEKSSGLIKFNSYANSYERSELEKILSDYLTNQ